MLRAFLLFLALSAFAASAWARTELFLDDCGSPGVTLSSVFMEEDDIPYGGTAHFTIRGTSKRKVTGGTYSAVVTRNFFGRKLPFMRLKGDICEVLGRLDDCEVNPDEAVTFVYSQDIPIYVPRGKYYTVIKAYDQHKKLLACFEILYPIPRNTAPVT